MSEALTKAQQTVFDEIKSWMKENGYPPNCP